MRLIDADKLTEDSDLIISIVGLVKKCHMKHKSGCCAPDCNECISRFFNNFNPNLVPTVGKESICSKCGSEFYESVDKYGYCPYCGLTLQSDN